MKTTTVEEQGNVQPQSPVKKPKPSQKASGVASKGQLAASQGQVGTQAQFWQEGRQTESKSR